MPVKEKSAEIKTKDYAGGWITEKEGTDAPPFLKLAFPLIGAGCIGYLLLYMNGEIAHSTRGQLVQSLNQSTSTADGFMYGVVAIMAVFVVIVVAFALRKAH